MHVDRSGWHGLWRRSRRNASTRTSTAGIDPTIRDGDHVNIPLHSDSEVTGQVEHPTDQTARLFVVSNGNCASTCAQFSTIMTERHNVTQVVFGGKIGESIEYKGQSRQRPSYTQINEDEADGRLM